MFIVHEENERDSEVIITELNMLRFTYLCYVAADDEEEFNTVSMPPCVRDIIVALNAGNVNFNDAGDGYFYTEEGTYGFSTTLNGAKVAFVDGLLSK